MVARYYSSAVSRFFASDPSTQSISGAFPQSWNRYSYVFNNPLRFVDPRGLKPGIDRGRGVPGSQTAVEAAGLNGGGRIGSSRGPRPVSFQDVDTPGASDNGSAVAGGGAFASYAAGKGGSSTDGGYVKVVGSSSAETVNNELANLQLIGQRKTLRDVARFPDYYRFQVNLGLIFGYSFQASVDRHLHFYVAPLGFNIGRSLTPISASLVGGWVLTDVVPSVQSMSDYMSGLGISIGGGVIGGGNFSLAPLTMQNPGLEAGLFSPQLGFSGSYAFQVGED